MGSHQHNQTKYDYSYAKSLIINYLDNCKYNNIISPSYHSDLKNTISKFFDEMKKNCEYSCLLNLWAELQKYSLTDQFEISLNAPKNESRYLAREQILINQDYVVMAIISYKYGKLIGGFEGGLNRCYLNCALQALCQIYEYNSSLFEETKIGQQLKILTQQKEQGTVSSEILYYFSKLSDQSQHHTQRGGDSYLSLISFLQAIKSELSPEQQIRFNQEFCVSSQDGFQCQNCKVYKKSLKKGSLSEDIYIYCDEEILGIEAKQIQDAFKPQDSYNYCISTDDTCNVCTRSQLIPQKTINRLPKFLVVNIFEHNPTLSINIDNQKFSFKNTKKSQQYSIIGIGAYFGKSHYIYQRKPSKKGGWICYNDSDVSYSYPSINYAKFIVFMQDP